MAALVEYDGTEYAGFQLQKRGRTIQSELERALAAVLGRDARVTVAGRTDAGVHARGQVIGLHAAWAHSLADLRRAWNANLPRDIAIRQVAAVQPGFHPRFDARSRLYRYQIYNGEVRSPLIDRYAWHVRRPLDVRRMHQASSLLLGRQDLASFGPAPQGENTVRTVLEARSVERGELICIEVEADAFLQHMMRRVAATLVAVGLGRMSVQGFDDVVRARDVSRTPGMAPPRGLCLVAVRYDPQVLSWSLPTREPWQKESCLE